MSLSRRTTLFAGLVFALAVPAMALQMNKYSAGALADAQKTGSPVLVVQDAPTTPIHSRVLTPVVQRP